MRDKMVAQTQPQMRLRVQTTVDPDEAACRDYVLTVENCFLEIRGRGVQWAETDRTRASAWYALGLPAGATVRVLQARVEAWRFRHGQNARLPMNLAWYEPAVLEHAKHLRQLGSAELDPLLETPTEAPSMTVTLLVAELSGLLAATQHQILQHVYGKTFDWLDAALQGARPDEDPQAQVEPGTPPDFAALVEKCRARMTKLLVSALDDHAQAELQQFLATEQSPGGALSAKARKLRQERLTERWLAGHFGHHVPTQSGWRDPRDA